MFFRRKSKFKNLDEARAALDHVRQKIDAGEISLAEAMDQSADIDYEISLLTHECFKTKRRWLN